MGGRSLIDVVRDDRMAHPAREPVIPVPPGDAHQAGIKPIIGVEAYVAPRGMTDKEGKADADYHHMIPLAQDDDG
jgi:hypothetical protein